MYRAKKAPHIHSLLSTRTQSLAQAKSDLRGTIFSLPPESSACRLGDTQASAPSAQVSPELSSPELGVVASRVEPPSPLGSPELFFVAHTHGALRVVPPSPRESPALSSVAHTRGALQVVPPSPRESRWIS